MDPATGTTWWSLEGREAFETVVAVGRRFFCAFKASQQQFVTVDLEAGSVAATWSVDQYSNGALIALPGDRIVLETEDARLAWYDVHTGLMLGDAA